MTNNTKKIIGIVLTTLGLGVVFFGLNTKESSEIKENIINTDLNSNKEEVLRPNETALPNPQTKTSVPSTNFNTPEAQSTPRENPNPISLAITIDEKDYLIPYQEGQTLHELMITGMAEGKFNFQARNYSGIGYYIQEINGKREGNGHYWIYYINDKKASRGISDYKPKLTDKIKWSYEKGY